MREDFVTATGFLGGVLEDRNASVAGEDGGMGAKGVGGGSAGGVGNDQDMGIWVVVEERSEFILREKEMNMY